MPPGSDHNPTGELRPWVSDPVQTTRRSSVRTEPFRCVLLADRHHGLSEGVRRLLETAFEVVVMVADEVSLVETARRLHPTLAVVDLSLPRCQSLGWLTDLRTEN